MEISNHRRTYSRKRWISASRKNLHKNGRTNRPITKLYPLEISAEISKEQRKQSNDAEETDTRTIAENNSSRPERAAALGARNRISKWVEELSPVTEDVE